MDFMLDSATWHEIAESGAKNLAILARSEETLKLAESNPRFCAKFFYIFRYHCEKN